MNLKNIWAVRVPKRVAKAAKKFPTLDQERIKEIMREFTFNPWTGDIAKIKGEKDKWRRRTGSFRIFYSVYPGIRLVEIKEIKRRMSSTY